MQSPGGPATNFKVVPVTDSSTASGLTPLCDEFMSASESPSATGLPNRDFPPWEPLRLFVSECD